MEKIMPQRLHTGRRNFVRQSTALMLGALCGSNGMAAESGIPHTTGNAPPRTKAPPLACDSHLHIVDARFAPAVPGAKLMQGATIADYRLLQRRIGTTRAVVVQPKVFGTDNRCTLDAVAQLGANGRGVGVLHPDASDKELQQLHSGGIRGLRFSIWNPADTVTTPAMIEPLARRIRELGWHVQLHMSGDQIVEHAAMLQRLPCPVVFDHMGRLSPKQGASHPAFAVIGRLVDKGNTWIKLSGAYLNTEAGPPAYPDATAIARAFVSLAPERLVWGSDWPHVTETHGAPDDAMLFDLLAEWSPDKNILKKILVDNPELLYGFIQERVSADIQVK
jgi:predicted TIM-barrel fold metal-dependent hydrolase